MKKLEVRLEKVLVPLISNNRNKGNLVIAKKLAGENNK
jgi:hypothetical protein